MTDTKPQRRCMFCRLTGPDVVYVWGVGNVCDGDECSALGRCSRRYRGGVPVNDGITIITCRRSRRAACKWCGSEHTKLCDYPLNGRKAGQTCDAKICDTHATGVGIDRDYCPPHARKVDG